MGTQGRDSAGARPTPSIVRRVSVLVTIALVLAVVGITWRSAEASGRRTLPDGCRVSAGSTGPDRDRGFAPGAEGESPSGWTEASVRPFDWDDDGLPDQLTIDDSTGVVTVRWASGALAVDGVAIPATAAGSQPGAPTGSDEEPRPQPAAVADVTGDGWPDLIVVSHGEARVLVGPGPAPSGMTGLGFGDIGQDAAGWASPPVSGPNQEQLPYDNVTVRPLWDLDADGADDFAVVSGARRTAGPIGRYRGRPCDALAPQDRLSHRPGLSDPGAIAGDGRYRPSAGSGTTTATGSLPPTVTFTTPTTIPGPPTTGRASVMTVDAPDPTTLRHGSDYWTFTTNTLAQAGGYLNVPVYHSSTLWFWDSIAEALPNTGSWSDGNHGGKVWAPSVHQFGSTYVLYYVARVRPGLGGAGRQCIGRATSSAPNGPYVDDHAAPIMCLALLGGSIDPDVFVDGSGVPWLISKNDGNCCGLPAGLWSVQLTADGLNTAGSAHQLLGTDQPWESPTIENPAMFDANGANWLFYSGNNWETANYAEGYGWCWQAVGPCTKTTTAGPWLSTTTFAKGPGGADFFQDLNGGWWVVYHGWLDTVGYGNGGRRGLFVDKVGFETGTPVIDSTYPFQSIIPKPPKVTGVTAVQTGHNSALVRWNPVQVDPPVGSYLIDAVEVGSQSQFGCGWGVSGSGVTEAVLTCLQDGHSYDITVRAGSAGGEGPRSDPVRITLDDSGARFVGVTPARVLDTRDGTGVAHAGHIGPGETVTLSLAGRGGLPAAGQFSGAVLNLTVTDPSGPSHLRVYPGHQQTPPESSSINFGAGTTIAAMVTAAVSQEGTVKIFNNSGQVHVIADIVGYYGAPNSDTGALHRSISPARVLDTRDGQGLPGSTPAKVGAQQSISLPLAGRGGLPAAGQFSSVILNVTAVGGSRISHLRVYPGDQASPPFASSVNFNAGQTIANLVTVRAAADGTVKLYNQSGDVDVVADVVGYYGPLGGAQGAKFYAMAPYRLMDTRWWPPNSGMSPVPAGQPLQIMIQTGGGPSGQEPISSAVMTMTVDQPSAASHLTVWPFGDTIPTASNLNFAAGQVIANQVSVQVGDFSPSPDWTFYAVYAQNNAGTVHIIADLNGWFGPEA